MRPSYVAALLLMSACTAFGEAPREDQADPAVDGLTTAPRAAPATPTTPAPTARPPTTDASTPPPPSAMCKDTPTRESCGACCSDLSAEHEAINRAWLTCACAPSRCADACATDRCEQLDERSPVGPDCSECLATKTDPCEVARDDSMANLHGRDNVSPCLAASDCASKPSDFSPGR